MTGLIDMNHAYDDNSVARVNGVTPWWRRPVTERDPRMTLVPNMANANQGHKRYQVPKN
jgi:hypothetical protein